MAFKNINPTLTTYPSCCGAAILTNFYSAKGSALAPVSMQDGLEFVRYYKNYNGSSIVVATLNTAQMKMGWWPFLKEAGFEFKGRWRGVHGTGVFLFVKPPTSSTQTVPFDPDTKWLKDFEEEIDFDAERAKLVKEAKVDPFGRSVV